MSPKAFSPLQQSLLALHLERASEWRGREHFRLSPPAQLPHSARRAFSSHSIPPAPTRKSSHE